jgi:hypothetical protein
VPTPRSSSSHQLELIQRYSRVLREQAAMYRGSRVVGAKERRLARQAAARTALDVTQPAKPAS